MSIRKTLIVCLASLCLAPVLSASAMELERDMILDFQIVVLPDQQALRVSGKDVLLTWPVKKVTSKIKGHDLLLSINLKIAGKKNNKGTFDKVISLPDEIDRVLLGQRQTVIWQRLKSPSADPQPLSISPDPTK